MAKAVASGDFGQATTTLIGSYGPQVFGYLRAILRDEDDAADAFALFTEKVWRGMATWEGRASARVWGFQVAWSAATRILRDPWHRRRQPLSAGAVSELAAAVMSSSRRDLDRQEGELEHLRRILTERERAIIKLHVELGLTWQEVAVAMDQPDDAASLAALRKRFERIKRKVAKEARARGLLRKS